MACKWMDNRSVLILSSALEGMNDILSVQRREKSSRPSLRLLALRLFSFTIAAWVELILWTSVLLHIVWIESHLLDFTSAFSFIWWLSHVSILTSFITWSILTNCLYLIRRLLSQKKPNSIPSRSEKGSTNVGTI